MELDLGLFAGAEGVRLALDADPGTTQRGQIALLEFLIGKAGVRYWRLGGRGGWRLHVDQGLPRGRLRLLRAFNSLLGSLA